MSANDYPIFEPFLMVSIAMALIFNVWLLWLKRRIRRFDKYTREVMLQRRDFEVIRRALSRSKGEDQRYLERLLCSMYMTVAAVPFTVLVAVIVKIVF